MAITVNVNQAKSNLSKLIEQVRHGEEVIIVRRREPCARLVPMGTRPPRHLGFVEGRLDEAFFEPLGEEEIAAWE